MKGREKQLNANRVSRDETAAGLAALRERVADADIKSRLRALEDKLAVCPPTASIDALDVDIELKTLTAEFMEIYRQGILTERYLSRMEVLVGKRMSLL